MEIGLSVSQSSCLLHYGCVTGGVENDMYVCGLGYTHINILYLCGCKFSLFYTQLYSDFAMLWIMEVVNNFKEFFHPSLFSDQA